MTKTEYKKIIAFFMAFIITFSTFGVNYTFVFAMYNNNYNDDCMFDKIDSPMMSTTPPALIPDLDVSNDDCDSLNNGLYNSNNNSCSADNDLFNADDDSYTPNDDTCTKDNCIYVPTDDYNNTHCVVNIPCTGNSTTTPPAITFLPSPPTLPIPELTSSNNYYTLADGEVKYLGGIYVKLNNNNMNMFNSNFAINYYSILPASGSDWFSFTPADTPIQFPDKILGSPDTRSHTVVISNLLPAYLSTTMRITTVYGVTFDIFIGNISPFFTGMSLTFTTVSGQQLGSHQMVVDFRHRPITAPTAYTRSKILTLAWNVIAPPGTPTCPPGCACRLNCFLDNCQCNFVPVANVVWENLGSPIFYQGHVRQLEYVITPSNATMQTVTWFSDDPSIAHVSETGLLTIGNPGITYIGLVTDDRGRSIRRQIIVYNNPNHPTMNVPHAPNPATGFMFQERGMIATDLLNNPYLIIFPNRTVHQGNINPVEFQIRNRLSENFDNISLVFTGGLSNVLEIVYPIGQFSMGSGLGAGLTTIPTSPFPIRHAAFRLRADAPVGVHRGYLEFYQNDSRMINVGWGGGVGVPMTWEVLPAPVYHNITLNTAQNGTATVSHSTATAATTITLAATPNAGYRFVEWNIQPAVSLATGSVTNPNVTFFMPNNNITITPVFGAIPTVAFNSVTANGTSDTVTTTQLTLNFNANPSALAIGNISVSGGLTISNLQGTGNSRTVNISGNWTDGQEITVTLTAPAGYIITPLTQTVTLFRSAAEPTPTPITFNGATANGTNGVTTTTQLTLNFNGNPSTLAIENISISGGVSVSNLQGTGNNRTLTISGNWTNGQQVTINLTDPTGYIITPQTQSATLHRATPQQQPPPPCSCANNGCGGNNNCASGNCTCAVPAPPPSAPTPPSNDVTGNGGQVILLNAQNPVITTQPQNNIVYIDEEIVLYAEANITDGGILSFQWYQNTANRGTGWVQIDGATQAHFTPPTDTIGIFYFRVVVINTNHENTITGRHISTTNSRVVSIEVIPLPGVIRPIPTIWAEPSTALIAELQGSMTDYFYDIWDYLEIEINAQPADNLAGGFVVADFNFTVGDEEIDARLREFYAYYTIFADLSDFIPNGLNYHRIVALHNGRIIGGKFNSQEMIFSVNVNTNDTFYIAYIEDLRRINLSPNAYYIIDLAGNAPMELMDVRPLVQNGRIMVPVRFITYILGGEVYWNRENNNVSIHLDGESITFRTGEMLPGMDVPVQTFNNRMYVPLRFVSEFFGAVVTWDGATEIAEIVRYVPCPERKNYIALQTLAAIKEDEIQADISEFKRDDEDPNAPDSKIRILDNILSLEELDAFELPERP